MYFRERIYNRYNAKKISKCKFGITKEELEFRLVNIDLLFKYVYLN